MSVKNTIRKGKRLIQASPPEEWRSAPRPNYTTNLDLTFPYAEYPRADPHEYYSVKLGGVQSTNRILDFWGEGRIDDGDLTTGFPNAYNVNHQFQLVSNGADRGKKIPNRIPTTDYESVSVAKYVPDASFDIITLMGAPIINTTATEIGRIISRNADSLVVIYGVSESDPQIKFLEESLDHKNLVLSPLYTLKHPLNQINMQALTFQRTDAVVTQATDFFHDAEMVSCAKVLSSLKRSSRTQNSAGRALRSFFNQSHVNNSSLIFALGYELDKTTDGKGVMDLYMNTNVVKIVRASYTSMKLQSNHGTAAYLCPNGKVASDSWQWAFFGTSTYIDTKAEYKGGEKIKLLPTASKQQFQIRSDLGAPSYLCINGSVSTDSWQWAFFGTAAYINSLAYKDGQFFYLIPMSGGDKFKVQASLGTESYLCTNGNVSSGSWQWAFFGTAKEIYSGGEVFTLVID